MLIRIGYNYTIMFEKISERLKERAQKIKIIGFDVDGVLTDGSILIGENGEALKKFSAFDGMGIRLAHQFGIETMIVSARAGDFPHTRFKPLGVTEIHTGVKDKVECVKGILTQKNLTLDECAFIGDDSVDLTLLEIVGLAACPPEAHYSVFKHIHYITERGAGKGCAREFVDLVLSSQGKIPA